MQTKDQLKSLLGELAGISGVSGHEQLIVARLRDLFADHADRLEIDPFGNIFAHVNRQVDGPTLMISAHSDEIGMMVKSIEPGGMIRFERVGGVVETLLIGRHVTIRGQRGVVGVKSGHLQSPEERGRAPKMRELYIDMGFDSAEEVEGLGIRVGDPVSYDEPMEELANPDRVSGKALDNRVACAILVLLAERLHDADLGCNLCLVVTVQEEVGLRGARMATYRLNPDAAIVVDTAPAGGTPDVDVHRDLRMRIGAGPVVALASQGGSSGYLIAPAMLRLLRAAASDSGVGVQESLFYGGNSDAAGVYLTRAGVPTGVINIARRYSHSPVEMLDINDAVGAVDLLEAAARQFSPETDLSFFDDGSGD